jgi:hypothetical protein
METQRICRAWGHSFARGFARVILDRVRDNLDQAIATEEDAGVQSVRKLGELVLGNACLWVSRELVAQAHLADEKGHR